MHIFNIFILKFGIGVSLLFKYTYKISFIVKFTFYKFIMILNVLRLLDLGLSPINRNFL